MSKNWDGVGLPEAGESVLIDESTALYEQRIRDFSGKEVLVEATFHFDEKLCLAVSHPTRGIGALIFNIDWVKPIKSDRDRAIEEILHIWKNTKKTFPGDYIHALAANIYDAGFRKQSGE